MKWIFLILLFPLTLLAEDCSPVNLITMPNSPFQKIPVYNQGKINICYAFSAAQMADFHLLLDGATDRRVHAAWVALNYALKKGRSSLEIGHTKEALEALNEAGNCPHDIVTNAITNYDSGELRRLYSSTDTLVSTLRPLCAPSARLSVKLPPALRYNYKQLPDDDSTVRFLSRRLSEMKSPISIAYCSNVWKDPEYHGILPNSRGIRDRVRSGCDYHESLIVGKKEFGGSCHFLVRNTWGNNWTKDNERWKCVCRNKTTNEYIEECHPDSHLASDYSIEACWLPGTTLKKNIGQVTFFSGSLPNP